MAFEYLQLSHCCIRRIQPPFYTQKSVFEKRLVFEQIHSFRYLYLSSLWLGVDPRTDTKKTRIGEGLDNMLNIC